MLQRYNNFLYFCNQNEKKFGKVQDIFLNLSYNK